LTRIARPAVDLSKQAGACMTFGAALSSTTMAEPNT
jgi:hypothetical protein